MRLYRYNHLSVCFIEAWNQAKYPGYPAPWFVVVDDDGCVLGDGATEIAAKKDYETGRQQQGLTPEAAAKRRRDQLHRKRKIANLRKRQQ